MDGETSALLRKVAYMDAAYLSALSALAGSVIGGSISGVTTWLSQRTQARAGELIREMSRRDELYADFIVEASKAYGEALVSNQPQVQGLVALYAMISRMRVMSSPRIVASAEKIMTTIVETYFAPNITIRDLHELIKSGVQMDPLKDFSEAARAERRASALL